MSSSSFDPLKAIPQRPLDTSASYATTQRQAPGGSMSQLPAVSDDDLEAAGRQATAAAVASGSDPTEAMQSQAQALVAQGFDNKQIKAYLRGMQMEIDDPGQSDDSSSYDDSAGLTSSSSSMDAGGGIQLGEGEPASSSSAEMSLADVARAGGQTGESLAQSLSGQGTPLDVAKFRSDVTQALQGSFSQQGITQYIDAALSAYARAGGTTTDMQATLGGDTSSDPTLTAGADASADPTLLDGADPSADPTLTAGADASSDPTLTAGATPTDPSTDPTTADLTAAAGAGSAATTTFQSSPAGRARLPATSSTGDVAPATATSDQMKAGGVQAGLDLVAMHLFDAPPLDLGAEVAAQKKELAAKGFAPDMIAAYASGLQDTFNAGLKAAAADPAGTATAYATPEFAKKITDGVLPAGVDAKPLISGLGWDASAIRAGQSAGSGAAKNGTPLNMQALSSDAVKSMGQAGYTDHAIALYLQNAQSSYNAGAKVNNPFAAPPPPPSISVPGVPDAWMQDASSRPLTSTEWSALTSQLGKLPQDQAQALIAQVQGKSPAYADALRAYSASTDPEPDRTANTFPPSTAAFPPTSSRPEEARVARVMTYTTTAAAKAEQGNAFRDGMAVTSLSFYNLYRTNPDQYRTAIAQVQDPNIRAAIDSLVHGYEPNTLDMNDEGSRRKALDFFGIGQFSRYWDSNGWRNNGLPAVGSEKPMRTF